MRFRRRSLGDDPTRTTYQVAPGLGFTTPAPTPTPAPTMYMAATAAATPAPTMTSSYQVAPGFTPAATAPVAASTDGSVLFGLSMTELLIGAVAIGAGWYFLRKRASP